MPTAVPMPAFSATVLAAALTSTGTVTSNSSTSFRVIVNMVSAVEPSALVARTVMLCDAAASRSNSEPLATVTTPELALIVNRPPASSVSE